MMDFEYFFYEISERVNLEIKNHNYWKKNPDVFNEIAFEIYDFYRNNIEFRIPIIRFTKMFESLLSILLKTKCNK